MRRILPHLFGSIAGFVILLNFLFWLPLDFSLPMPDEVGVATARTIAYAVLGLMFALGALIWFLAQRWLGARLAITSGELAMDAVLNAIGLTALSAFVHDHYSSWKAVFAFLGVFAMASTWYGMKKAPRRARHHEPDGSGP